MTTVIFHFKKNSITILTVLILAGLSSMSFKKFLIIILLCLPVSLIGYSAGFSAVTALL